MPLLVLQSHLYGLGLVSQGDCPGDPAVGSQWQDWVIAKTSLGSTTSLRELPHMDLKTILKQEGLRAIPTIQTPNQE